MRAFELFSRHRAAVAQRLLAAVVLSMRLICSGCEGTLLHFCSVDRWSWAVFAVGRSPRDVRSNEGADEPRTCRALIGSGMYNLLARAMASSRTQVGFTVVRPPRR